MKCTSRVIRGEINASESLSRVSLPADLTFRALLLAADDYGRLDARPKILQATLFPLRPSMTPKKIDGCLRELERERCILRYAVDGHPYLAVLNWEKHRSGSKRALRSRIPAPPGNPQRSPEQVRPGDPGGPGDPGSLGSPPSGSGSGSGGDGGSGRRGHIRALGKRSSDRCLSPRCSRPAARGGQGYCADCQPRPKAEARSS